MVLIIEYDTFTDNFLCRLLLPVFLEKKHWSLECLPKYAFLIFFLQEWKVCKESYCWIEIIFSIEDCIVLLSISIAHTKRVKSIIRNHTDSTTWKVSVFGVILVRIFLHLDWIQRDTLYPSVFSANAGKPWPEYFRIRALFTRCSLYLDINLVTILPVYNAK